MIDTKVYDSENPLPDSVKKEVVDFLYNHLEQYGDAPQDIQKAIDYSTKAFDSYGGFTMLLQKEGKILAAVVMNRTGMGGYIPENILVYIATHKEHRGEGIGKMLMNKALEHAEGDIALHVEANNPAKFLYEKLGFKNPYLEMRLKR